MKYEITSDRSRLDFDRVYGFLNGQSYWANGIPRELFDRAMANSLCFGGMLGGEQIAFARVISDYATFANLVDVYVERDFRGMGYAFALLEAVFAHPDLQGLRRFMLATSDAHHLYARFGFHTPARPETLMERYHPDVYRL
ncbi:GNAT family N-acetyltransferase [Asticcacaulis sp. AC402]|uniref:GNAT family N-acetyltransferase n=1 Tax=Asticcacaulis sp. AC402 TaxID=1282361 RepID=UPI0003C40E17|nr:GNAT family N-acetyltransferase [Asticcacaulis sp. AC402]ESQ76179.1 GNAT family acetyltransferase [Asticcacaulis sp. AC402]